MLVGLRSKTSLADLDVLKARIDPAALDQAVRNVNGHKDVSVIRIRVPHR
jgi:hypothetical protein